MVKPEAPHVPVTSPHRMPGQGPVISDLQLLIWDRLYADYTLRADGAWYSLPEALIVCPEIKSDSLSPTGGLGRL